MEIIFQNPFHPLHPCTAAKTSCRKRSRIANMPVFPSLLRGNSLWRFSARNVPVSNCCKRQCLLLARCKMFVPAGNGSQSPEARAADTLHNYFTYLAVNIVLAQLQEYNPEAYAELRAFVDKTSLKDGDKFCAALMRESSRHRGLALRILEVRSAYASEDFEWENMKRLALKHAENSNKNLMRQFLVETSDME